MVKKPDPSQNKSKGFNPRPSSLSKINSKKNFLSDNNANSFSPTTKLDDIVWPLIVNGRYNEAQRYLSLLVQSKTENAKVYVLLGIIYDRQQESEKAFHAYSQALKIDANQVDALTNLANICAIKNMLHEAERLYTHAFSIDKSYESLLFNYSNFLLINDRLDEAIKLLEHWIELHPQNPTPYSRLGYCFCETGKLFHSREVLKKSLAIRPEHPETLGYLASTELKLDENELALSLAKHAHSLDPSSLAINLILGNLYLYQGSYDDALKHLLFVGHNACGYLMYSALYNSSFAYFGLNERLLGYTHYEYRSMVPNLRRFHIVPEYTPITQSVNNDELILFSEQGFGDTLQFVRYAPWLLNNRFCAKLTLYVQNELVCLLSESMPEVKVFYHQHAPKVLPNKALPLLSCPSIYGENSADLSLHKKYLVSNSERKTYWQKILRNNHKDEFLIAVCWQGNPEAEKTQNRGRSIPLSTLIDVANIPNVRLVSLQKGFGSEQLNSEYCAKFFVSSQDLISESMAFEDSAAIIENCNLMITTDTGPAHLCGALGKPLWLLLSYVPDWRWGPKGECSFWYEDLTIFQQTKRGEWDNVINKVKSELYKRVHS